MSSDQFDAHLRLATEFFSSNIPSLRSNQQGLIIENRFLAGQGESQWFLFWSVCLSLVSRWYSLVVRTAIFSPSLTEMISDVNFDRTRPTNDPWYLYSEFPLMSREHWVVFALLARSICRGRERERKNDLHIHQISSTSSFWFYSAQQTTKWNEKERSRVHTLLSVFGTFEWSFQNRFVTRSICVEQSTPSSSFSLSLSHHHHYHHQEIPQHVITPSEKRENERTERC